MSKGNKYSVLSLHSHCKAAKSCLFKLVFICVLLHAKDLLKTGKKPTLIK